MRLKQFASLLMLMLLGLDPLDVRAEVATGQHGMVATVHPLATEAGLNVLKDGGNAVDAAVAAALMLGVVDGYNSGIGGGCFIVIRTAEGKLLAIDGRETAPAKSTRDMYIRDGKADTNLSQTGPLASGTPGALAAYEMAIQKAGNKELADLIWPAAKIARDGFKIDAHYAERLKDEAETLAKFPGSKAVFFKPNGELYQEGELLRQKDLAYTYGSIAKWSTSWFYHAASIGEGGPETFAKTVSNWMSENGGILSEEDFANYKPVLREPIISEYRDYFIVGFPPPSSGGVHVAQILNILSHFDLKEMHAEDEVAYTHVMSEAMKLAFADRAYWLGDPAFADVPRGLISPDYGKELAGKIDLNKAVSVKKQNMPPRADSDFFPRHTTHISVADAKGNWVAITATINTTFGSKVIVPGTGVVLNNEMDDFSAQPGVPNAFGLVGAEANAIQPGKRPLSSMSPTIVLKEREPVLTVGAAGGPKIITQVVQAIIRTIDLGESLDQAVGGSRIHHQWRPDEIQAEQNLSPKLIKGLKAKGHAVKLGSHVGVTQAISRDAEGEFHGVSDPRVNGRAEGY